MNNESYAAVEDPVVAAAGGHHISRASRRFI
jgi:hypothetical protein